MSKNIMVIHLLRDYTEQDIDRAIEYVKSIGFKRSTFDQPGQYRKINGVSSQSIYFPIRNSIKSSVQTEVGKEVLQGLVKVLRPEFFQNDNEHRFRPISELEV